MPFRPARDLFRSWLKNAELSAGKANVIAIISSECNARLRLAQEKLANETHALLCCGLDDLHNKALLFCCSRGRPVRRSLGEGG